MSRKADFRCLERLGAGSFGKVDKVQRVADGEIFVCKQVSMAHFNSEKARAQALSEAAILKKLDCPYIVEYKDAFIEKSNLYLILQYCDSGDLKSFLKSAQALPVRSVWRIFLRMSLGLQYLHDRRILHRDIKSENIFLHLSEDGVRIGDLGLAKMMPENQTGASTLVGTPRYLSPEEVQGIAHYNSKCDVWSLGIILYELCSDGHKGPFDMADRLPHLMRAICELEPKALPESFKEFQEVTNMLLKKDGQQRASMAQLFAMDQVVENGEKHGVLELSESGDSGETSSPAPRKAAERCRGAAGLPRDPPEGTAGEASPFLSLQHVRDGVCSRLAVFLGLAAGEPPFGPRFKRLAYCEVCKAEGAGRIAFSSFFRRHHCRGCGRSVCRAHSKHRQSFTDLGHTSPQRICKMCSQKPPSNGGA